jgi:hypothetical protein
MHWRSPPSQEWLAEGMTEAEILGHFPYLEPEEKL